MQGGLAYGVACRGIRVVLIAAGSLRARLVLLDRRHDLLDRVPLPLHDKTSLLASILPESLSLHGSICRAPLTLAVPV